ncbi:hypothetical protein CLV58_102202 [Spirosoma oryzae]|uniref:Polymerase beta nucleotidyltransferase domain-containing protein n=1 Tax=Spirosoma oryzae TaxID=1469603 RepID=A0A2T0TIG3_9BACT|nr:nucleotidyltransferase domain-containing protein [Spirosoma oryzae]PRY45453.1 hypothetical protein CLV58_102202 [Spirosoma oryzae]
MTLSANELNIICHYLQGKPVVRAYVFGSYARNEADTTSDLDLLVELDYSQPIGLQFIGMKLDLEDSLHKRVDLVSLSGLSPRLRPFIEKDRQLIYERTVR